MTLNKELISRELLSDYFGDDDYEQLLEYIYNLLNKKIDLDTCISEVICYEE